MAGVGATTGGEGNVSLRMDVKDGGSSPGSRDEIGFTILSSQNSTLFYSNNWIYDSITKSWKTVRQQLAGNPASNVTIA